MTNNYSLEKRTEPSLVQRVKDYFFPQKHVPEKNPDIFSVFTEEDYYDDKYYCRDRLRPLIEETMKRARRGYSLSSIEVYFKETIECSQRARFSKVLLDPNIWKENVLREYELGIKIFGQENTTNLVDLAFAKAKAGQKWEPDYQKAKDYAQEANIPLEDDLKKKLKLAYKKAAENKVGALALAPIQSGELSLTADYGQLSEVEE